MPNRKQAHSVAPPGKRVLVRLKNGETFIDKFRDKAKGFIVFDEHKIRTKDLQMLTIYRQMPERDKRADEIIKNMGVKLPKAVKQKLRAELTNSVNSKVEVVEIESDPDTIYLPNLGIYY